MSLFHWLPLSVYCIACIPLDGDPGADAGATEHSAPPGPHSALALEDCEQEPIDAELVADFAVTPTARNASQLFEFGGQVYFTDHTTIWSDKNENKHRAPGGTVFGTGAQWIAVDTTRGRVQSATMPEGSFSELAQTGRVVSFRVDSLGVVLAGTDSLSYLSIASGKLEWSFPSQNPNLDLAQGAVSDELGLWLLAQQENQLLVQYVERESGEITRQQAVPWPHGIGQVRFSMAREGWLGYVNIDGDAWGWHWLNPASSSNETAIEGTGASGSVNHSLGPHFRRTSLVGLDPLGRWLSVSTDGQCQRSGRRFQRHATDWHSGAHYLWDEQGIWRVGKR